MITLLTGSPGHGKSYTLVREIELAVAKGQPVATNVPLAEDWPTIMARRHTLFGRFRPAAVERKANDFARRVMVSEDFGVLLRVRLAGEGEGRGKLILDEAQRWMNTRGWDNAVNDDGTPMKRAEALSARMAVLNHLSGHRHYGLDVILATQSQKAIDTQARDLYEFHSEVRNLRRLPWIGLFMRFNLFVKVTRWNDHSKSKAGVDCYWLSKSLARLYQTHALQNVDWPEDAIILPRDAPDEAIPSRGIPKPDPLALGTVYRMPNGQLATVSTGNKDKLEKAREDDVLSTESSSLESTNGTSHSSTNGLATSPENAKPSGDGEGGESIESNENDSNDSSPRTSKQDDDSNRILPPTLKESVRSQYMR